MFWKLWRHNDAKIRVSKGLKSKYLQLCAEYSITTPETPYRLSKNGLITAIGHLRCCRWFISWILGSKGGNSLKMTKLLVSMALKSKYLQLRAEYSIRTPETPYRVSIAFSESSQHFLSDRLGKLLSYLIFRPQSSKICIFRRFYHISLIKSLLSGCISVAQLKTRIPYS